MSSKLYFHMSPICSNGAHVLTLLYLILTMNNKIYETPAIEVLELEVESAIMTASGEDSVLDFGE